MAKLDESKVRYIPSQRRKGVPTGKTAETMGVSARWIRRLYARYRNVDLKDVAYPTRTGRPKSGPPGRREHSAALAGRQTAHMGATGLEREIEEATGLRMPHNTIHEILKDEEMARNEPKKSGRRKWVRYERTHSNSMWHTDYKQLDDGRWFLCYEDDASRFVTGYGVFEHATAENALAVLDRAIKDRGRPASIMTDHARSSTPTRARSKERGSPNLRGGWRSWRYARSWRASATPRPTASWSGSAGRCGAIYACSATWPGGRARAPSTRRTSRCAPWRGS